MEIVPVVTPDRIVKLGLAFRGAKALLSAAELGVFTALAEGPLDLETLAKQVGVHERGARDFFDALVALGMLERDENGCYANTPETNLYLDRHKPTYIGGELEHFNALLTRALRTGEPQSGARATGHYSALYSEASSARASNVGALQLDFWRARVGSSLSSTHRHQEGWRTTSNTPGLAGHALVGPAAGFRSRIVRRLLSPSNRHFSRPAPPR